MDNLTYFYEDSPWLFDEDQTLIKNWNDSRKAYGRFFAWILQMVPVVTTIVVAAIAITKIFPQIEATAESFTLFILLILNLTTISMALLSARKYEILSDRITIVRGLGRRSYIYFRNIREVTAATFKDLWGLNLNFINSYSSNDILRITKKHGLKIHITPWDRSLFLENLDNALTQWRKYHVDV